MSSLLALVVLAALVLYAVFGGADFGGGFWHLLASGPRKRAQQELIENALAPVWEANHVWLILALVLVFTGFPVAFSAIMTVLHIPLTLILIGIIFRGAAFVFRQYGHYSEKEADRWGKVFSLTSLLTPFFLGMCVGALCTGRFPKGTPTQFSEYVTPWLSPFPIAVGFLTVALFAWIAAVFLTCETQDKDLQNDFKFRALFAALLVLFFEVISALVLDQSAAHFRTHFVNEGAWIRFLHALSFFAAIAMLIQKRNRWARVFAIIQIASVIVGWGYSQYPYVIAPHLTLAAAAAPDATIRLLLIALATGSVILFPSLFWLLSIFKRSRRVP